VFIVLLVIIMKANRKMRKKEEEEREKKSRSQSIDLTVKKAVALTKMTVHYSYSLIDE
jgi:hypothetical protein